MKCADLPHRFEGGRVQECSDPECEYRGRPAMTFEQRLDEALEKFTEPLRWEGYRPDSVLTELVKRGR